MVSLCWGGGFVRRVDDVTAYLAAQPSRLRAHHRNKLSLRVYCCCCRRILHLQQYSRRLNLLRFFFILDKIATWCRSSLAVHLLANMLYYYSCAYEIWCDTNKNTYTHFVWNVIFTLTTTNMVVKMRVFEITFLCDWFSVHVICTEVIKYSQE